METEPKYDDFYLSRYTVDFSITLWKLNDNAAKILRVNNKDDKSMSGG